VEIYFSHSYRDVAVNGYFIERLAREGIPLRADQKTDCWCIAKLERYLSQTQGFISIIPRRANDQDPAGYSPYIGRELDLARRARAPRLLFIDEKILKVHRLDFPEDIVSFNSDEIVADAASHDDAIRKFSISIETKARSSRDIHPGEVAVVASNAGALGAAARDVADMFQRERFTISPLFGRFVDRGLDDIRLLEALWRAELCVFLLDERISDTHIALAMAHAHCIPSIRLQYDRRARECNTSISGTIRWSDRGEMLVELERQIVSYREGLIAPVEIAAATSAVEAAQAIGTMRWQPRDDNLWDMQNAVALLRHVRASQAFVQDEVNRIGRAYGSSLGQARSREASMTICRITYESICRFRFGFEFEPYQPASGIQTIRTPTQIETHRSANCLDLACLFASILESAKQAPIIVVLDGPGYAHALVGVRAPGEPAWRRAELGDLRRALLLGDALFFEPTGAVESDFAVGAEADSDRRDKLLDFMSAKTAASLMIERNDIRLRHVIDVQDMRRSTS
jgi:hypothetical protein